MGSRLPLFVRSTAPPDCTSFGHKRERLFVLPEQKKNYQMKKKLNNHAQTLKESSTHSISLSGDDTD